MAISEQLIEAFLDTQSLYQEDPILARRVRDSIRETRLYAADDYPVLPPSTERTGAVRVRKRAAYQAALELCRTYPEKKIAILNFTSAVIPGGGIQDGGSGEEEDLCRCSTLYPTLDQQWLKDSFYHSEQGDSALLRSDACIYSPGVVICKAGDDVPAQLWTEKFMSMDVISCAVPDRGCLKDGKIPRISYDEFCRVLRCRALHIFHVAAVNQVDVLVLGGFVCHAFKREIIAVRNAFWAALDAYRKWFNLIEFAVCCQDEGENIYRDLSILNNYQCLAEDPITILDAGREAREEYGEAYGAQIERLTAEQLNALHSGKQLAISVMGEYVLFLEGPATRE